MLVLNLYAFELWSAVAEITQVHSIPLAPLSNVAQGDYFYWRLGI